MAVLLVVLAHAGVPGLAGGYIGVDVFLVLSGYLITSLLLREATTTGTVDLTSFYARRARRILPAATLTLLATLFVATLTLPYTQAYRVLQDAEWSTFFAANWHFAQLGTDYFSSGLPPSPVQHYWSLAVEEQFYLVWPVVLALVLSVGLRRPKSAVIGARGRVRVLCVVLLAATAGSFVWAATHVGNDPAGTYFSTLARAWELGAGALLALLGSLPARLPFPARGLLSWGGLIAIVAAATRFGPTTPVPGTAALLPVLGTVAVIACGAGGSTAGPARMLGGWPLSRLGDLSYSFYLWHWPFLVLPAAWAGHELGLVPALALSAVALATSVLTYRLFEDPIRSVRGLSLRPQLALGLWPVTVTLVLVGVLWSGGRIATAANTSMGASVSAAGESTPAELATAVAQAVREAERGAPLPRVVQDLRTLSLDRPPACIAAAAETVSRLCPSGDLSAGRTVVVLGDSHARMWLPAVDAIAAERGWRVVPLLKMGCRPLDWPLWDAASAHVGEFCQEFSAWARAQVDEIQPDLVVVAGKAPVTLANEAGDGPMPPGDASLAAWQTGMQRLVDRLLRSADAVRLVLDTPALSQNPADCLSAAGATMASCTEGFPPQISEFNARTQAVAAATRGVATVDMTRYVCWHGRCPMVVSGIAVYADDDHLSRTYVQHLTPAFAAEARLPRAAPA